MQFIGIEIDYQWHFGLKLAFVLFFSQFLPQNGILHSIFEKFLLGWYKKYLSVLSVL